MRPDPITLPSRCIESGEALSFVRLRADRIGMSLSDVLARGAFAQQQTRLVEGDILRVHGVDGRCWAEVVGITDNGRLVIEPDTVLGPVGNPPERRGPGRPPKIDAA